MPRAWLLLLVLGGTGACGSTQTEWVDDVPEFPDAGFADASTAPDAPPSFGPLTVRVLGADGQPLAGADVVTGRFDSFDVAIKTDVNGEAHPMVNVGDTVTAAYSVQNGGTERHVMTWVGVEPGDVLTLGAPARDRGATLGTMTVTPPPAVDGASVYRASSGCGDEQAQAGGPEPLAYTLFAGCHPDASHVPVLLEARDAAGRMVAYASRTDAAVADMAASASFDAWRTDAIAFSAGFSHLPVPAPQMDHHLALLAAGGELFELPVRVDPATPALVSTDVPAGLAPAWIYADRLVEGDGSQSRWRVVGGSAPIPTGVTLDVASGLLAQVESFALEASDPSRLSAEWNLATSTGSIVDDAVLVTFQLGGPGGGGTWTLALAPGSGQLRLPQLPDSMASFRPTQAPGATTIVLIDSNNAEYKQLRRVLNGVAQDGSALWPIVTSPLGSGTVRMSERVFFNP